MENNLELSIFPQNYMKSYEGANGNKICLTIHHEDYMVKFPVNPTKNENISYTNNCICEYIGCHIFELAGINVQKTYLGTYTQKNGNQKIVVACEDFTTPNERLISFIGLKNQVIDSPQTGKGTELSSIKKSIEEQQLFDSEKLSEWFWDMFIVDALIGNWDRHNGNWGYLYNTFNNSCKLAPVYDCASSLFPQADEDIMRSVLKNENELKSRVFSKPTSAIQLDSKRINYNDFINSLQDNDCNQALKRILPKISKEKVNEIIDSTPYITNLQKTFYKTILAARRDIILQRPFDKLIKLEQELIKNKCKKQDEKNYDDYGYGR